MLPLLIKCTPLIPKPLHNILNTVQTSSGQEHIQWTRAHPVGKSTYSGTRAQPVGTRAHPVGTRAHPVGKSISSLQEHIQWHKSTASGHKSISSGQEYIQWTRAHPVDTSQWATAHRAGLRRGRVCGRGSVCGRGRGIRRVCG